MNRNSAATPLMLLLVGSALILRVVLALRPGLWGDEIFSLAMATGHSLEHPAAEARGGLGDFIQPPGVEPSSSFRRYAESESPPAGPGRVIRAVLLSDTSPPLYYLLLNGWSRIFGTSDAALRSLSLLFALLTIPVLWLLGRDLGGRGFGWMAVLLYAWSPASVFYSVEGRMYSLVWLLAAALAWQTLRVARLGLRPSAAAAWLALAAAGLYTHYFFLFVWLACGAWLMVWPGRTSRPRAAALIAGAAIAAAPWYLQVPGSLARWRVTADWLSEPLHWPEIATRPFELAWSLLAGGSLWGGSPVVDGVLAVAYLCLTLWIIGGRRLRELFSPDRLLVWAWVAAAVLGPYVFDLLRQTGASRIPRYVLSGLPGALLLAAMGIQQLGPRFRTAFVGLVLVGWTAGLWPIVRHANRPGAVYGALASDLERWAGPDDLVLLHSVPSGIIGLSRYLRRDLPVLAWIEPLGLRRPGDLERLLAGRRRVALVQVHNIGQPSTAEPWLRAHARLADRRIYDGTLDALTSDLESLSPVMQAALAQHRLVEILYFEPIDGAAFAPARR